jgi:hypothetical protein
MKVKSQLEALTIFAKYDPKAVIDLEMHPLNLQSKIPKVFVILPHRDVSVEDRKALRNLGWYPELGTKGGLPEHWWSMMQRFT